MFTHVFFLQFIFFSHSLISLFSFSYFHFISFILHYRLSPPFLIFHVLFHTFLWTYKDSTPTLNLQLFPIYFLFILYTSSPHYLPHWPLHTFPFIFHLSYTYSLLAYKNSVRTLKLQLFPTHPLRIIFLLSFSLLTPLIISLHLLIFHTLFLTF